MSLHKHYSGDNGQKWKGNLWNMNMEKDGRHWRGTSSHKEGAGTEGDHGEEITLLLQSSHTLPLPRIHLGASHTTPTPQLPPPSFPSRSHHSSTPISTPPMDITLLRQIWIILIYCGLLISLPNLQLEQMTSLKRLSEGRPRRGDISLVRGLTLDAKLNLSLSVRKWMIPEFQHSGISDGASTNTIVWVTADTCSCLVSIPPPSLAQPQFFYIVFIEQMLHMSNQLLNWS